MIQVNAMYPIWQVVEWESLLEMLDKEEESEESATGIVDLYIRPQSVFSIAESDVAKEFDDDSAKDFRNVRVLMLTLALQMVGNSLDIANGHLLRLKYFLVKSMGFNDCVLKRIGPQRYELSFGDLSSNTDDFWNIGVLMASVRGMKRALDNFTPLKEETVAAVGSAIIDEARQLNESSIGSVFVEVVLKMFNSGIDLTNLSHFMLRSWLELVLIIVYKVCFVSSAMEHRLFSLTVSLLLAL